MVTQDTADANYMLLTVAVNGHNCLPFVATAKDGNAVTLPWRRMATQQNMPRARFEQHVAFIYDDAVCENTAV